ncbi:universal stress protein [Novosphingobium sp.]|uniref:universal stress protein n=1 Tax=Novosphingobium sp. TaxID=1874826 RepID=UPI0025E70380|nr:universal stress protein [Novosphingobium sp.]
MRSILVQTGRDAGMSSRLDTAMGIARAHGGHVTLLIDTPVSRYVTADPYGGTFVAREALDAALAADDELAAAFAGRLQNDDVPFDVAQYETEPLAALNDAARLADLVVVARDCGYCGDLALATQVPVLILPEGARLDLPLRSAAIAWNGATEAANALRGAVPLLQGCEAVSVITVTSGNDDDFPPTEALRYLARHGIEAELLEIAMGSSVEETLAAAVHAKGAQLLVMGAYGRSRLGEFLFGGVTRYFLKDARALPLLIAH